MHRSSLTHLKTSCASIPAGYPVLAKSGTRQVVEAIRAQARAKGRPIVDVLVRMPKPRKGKVPTGTGWHRLQNPQD